uniref:Uncharacterized protein n=1 Tax=Meloidogyne floridensis TaxID=298350 RepID=A0A915P0J5_9BILA
MLLGPPPSYSEAISSSSSNQSQQQIFSITQYTPPPNVAGRTQLIFPYHQNNDVENSSISPTYRADRLRDLFLSILARILVIFLFVVFIRLMIAQLNN